MLTMARFLRRFPKILILLGILAVSMPGQRTFAQGVDASLTSVQKQLEKVSRQLDQLKAVISQDHATDIQDIVLQVAKVSVEMGRIHERMTKLSVEGPRDVVDRLQTILEEIRGVRLTLTRRVSDIDSNEKTKRDIWRSLARAEHDLEGILILHEKKETLLLRSP